MGKSKDKDKKVTDERTTIAIWPYNRDWLVGLKRGHETYDDVLEEIRAILEKKKLVEVKH